MYTAVLAVHIILAVILIGLVLLQQGKGADVGAVMGGGANTLFGVGGASSLLVRATTGIAICRRRRRRNGASRPTFRRAPTGTMPDS